MADEESGTMFSTSGMMWKAANGPVSSSLIELKLAGTTQ